MLVDAIDQLRKMPHSWHDGCESPMSQGKDHLPCYSRLHSKVWNGTQLHTVPSMLDLTTGLSNRVLKASSPGSHAGQYALDDYGGSLERKLQFTRVDAILYWMSFVLRADYHLA